MNIEISNTHVIMMLTIFCIMFCVNIALDVAIIILKVIIRRLDARNKKCTELNVKMAEDFLKEIERGRGECHRDGIEFVPGGYKPSGHARRIIDANKTKYNDE